MKQTRMTTSIKQSLTYPTIVITSISTIIAKRKLLISLWKGILAHNLRLWGQIGTGIVKQSPFNRQHEACVQIKIK